MYWEIPLIISVVLFLSSIIIALSFTNSKNNKLRNVSGSKIMLVGTVLSSFALFLPIYIKIFKETQCGLFETLLISIHNIIRLFVVDGDFDFITSNLSDISEITYRGYTIIFAVLFVAAPFLTFGFVLSFFNNISAYKRYFTYFSKDIYVFSELNKKSVALAKSLNEENRNSVCIFADVFQAGEEKEFELLNKAKELGAICFNKDIVSINFNLHSKKSNISFFTMGDDQTENVSQALQIINRYNQRNNTNLYVFSASTESEMLLENVFADNNDNAEFKIKVRRVDPVRSFISRTLYDNGYENIFANAVEDSQGIKHISALIIGMGEHGTEMTKNLAWFCQMDGYRAEINSFDIQPDIKSRFSSLCPELVDEKYNSFNTPDGEAKYKINIHSGYDVNAIEFDNAIVALPDVTYAFVSLGNEELNLSVALKLRTLFLRKGLSPKIQAVLYNSEKKQSLDNITNYKNQAYNIDFVGDAESCFTKSVILNSDLEKEALNRHLKWGREQEFWKYSYNYKSSIASVIHKKMKILCGIPGADLTPDKRNESEKQTMRKLEHCRWNAYMRSEGYCYANERNDLAKTHNCLVPFDMLSEKEKAKDDD